MTSEEIIMAKHQLRQHLQRLLNEGVFHGQPTERLAAEIAVHLINQNRHAPWALLGILARINELRGRITNAKV